MEALQFTAAHYIKLGRGGEYVQDSFQHNRLRFGWRGQSVEDIRANRWTEMAQAIRTAAQGKRRSAGSVINPLRRIVEAKPDEVWITFHESKLWWARVTGEIFQDDLSKYRNTVAPWSDKTLKDRLLVGNELPGKIARLQAYRATTCRVRHVDLLRRLLNGTRSPIAEDIKHGKGVLAGHLGRAIRELHWRDFETLVDLVFRATGWIRVSVLGEQEKGCDLVLQEAITRDRFVVQVKSQAGLAEVTNTAAEFSPPAYRKVFFVVHTPNPDLMPPLPPSLNHVEVVDPNRLGVLALNAGLTDWLADKVV